MEGKNDGQRMIASNSNPQTPCTHWVARIIVRMNFLIAQYRLNLSRRILTVGDKEIVEQKLWWSRRQR